MVLRGRPRGRVGHRRTPIRVWAATPVAAHTCFSGAPDRRKAMSDHTDASADDGRRLRRADGSTESGQRRRGEGSFGGSRGRSSASGRGTGTGSEGLRREGERATGAGEGPRREGARGARREGTTGGPR